MKRLIALLAAFAVLVACNSETTPAVARLSGTYDMALVGNLLFVTSADKNELRVLDLAASPRDFVRAPNPIEPLSIPVIERAVGLVKDLSYDESGAEAPARYVYAYSAAAPSISIVGTEALKELLRLPTQDQKPVSAVSAVGPGGDHPDKSVLYYATSSGTASTIYKVQLSTPDQLEKAMETKTMPPAETVMELTNESVSALLALPRTADSAQEQLVVATRSSAGRSGRTFVLPGETPLAFPYPVRLLATHPQAQSGDQRLPARTRIFGVLDEEACGSSRDCRGILAADVATGEISKDFTGRPMLPIRPAQGLLLSLSLAAGKFVLVPNADLTSTGFSLLGMGAASDGKVFFFDAWNLTVVDAIPAASAVQNVVLQDPTGTVQVLNDAYGLTTSTNFTVKEGVARDENIVMTYKGLVPGLSDLPTSDAEGQQFKFPSQFANRVHEGDIIVAFKESGLACSGTELTISRVILPDTLETSSSLGECSGRTRYSVRAGAPDKMFTVVGDVSGYLGRTGPGVGSTFLGPRLRHAAPGDADPDILLGFTMGALDPRLLAPDWRYVLSVASNYDPLFFAADAATFTGFYLPTSVVQLPFEATVLVSYPSANGIIEFTPILFGANQLNSRNIKVYQ